MAIAITPSGALGERAADAGHRQLSTLHGGRDRRAQGVVAVAVEQDMELLDAATRKLRLSMGDLGEQDERLTAKVEQLLSLLVELGPSAVDGGDLRSAMLGQRRWRLALAPASVSRCARPAAATRRAPSSAWSAG